MSGRRRRGQAGFSLMEVLLATALMGMILTAMGMVTAQWLPNWNRGFANVQRSELFVLGLERLVADLAAAESIPLGAPNSPIQFEGGEASVTFVRTALGPNARPGLELVRVAEAPDQFTPMLVRMRAPFVPAGEGAVARFDSPVTLMRAPYRVAFAYAGPDQVWRAGWRNAALLPRAIRVQVRDAGSGALLAFSTATLVHSQVPADCVLAEVLANCLSARELQEASRLNPSATPSLRNSPGGPP
jgi:general secretion pathway protein J